MSFLIAANTIDLLAGQSKTLRLTVLDADGQPVDLSPVGTRVVLTVRCDERDPTPRLVKDSDQGPLHVEFETPREGVVLIHLSPSDTATLTPFEYVYDVWVVLDGASYPVIPRGAFAVRQPITALRVM